MPIILLSIFGIILVVYSYKLIAKKKALKEKLKELQEVEMQGDVLDLDETIIARKLEQQKQAEILAKRKGKLNVN